MAETWHASEAFDEVAAGYDRWIRIAVPTYEEVYRVALEAIEDHSPVVQDVVDLGAGTGLFSAQLAIAHSTARYHLVDASEQMLNVARSRFEAMPVTASFAHHAMEDFSDHAAYDAAVSGFAIHHLEDAAKQRLFRAIYKSLRPNGVFVNIDQIRADRRFGDTYWDHWLARVREAGGTESQIESSVRRRHAHDRDSTLEEQLRWLGEAGFVADCRYKHYFVGVFVAVKPDGGPLGDRR